MTKKELRKKAEQILQGALLNPNWKTKHDIEIYRTFWQGKRMGIMELLHIDTCLRYIEFPLPWEKEYRRRQDAKDN